ncbi:MAG: dienelactone hydrolase family protein [Alphaproteobacteria bacterium]|nr:hypothetical protein [Rhodospirillaceae bacterium]MDG2483130.1 dienelactone hydrolase family protein [Alphaproteobacteria bacterium]MBT6202744.1 hypothetical protein [Rhodospirillaceae bacterium]MBT6512554.1 hypothetical protein [Rhodospirillaceae bacterium]MBT7615224.1 hypothetical protein [Rhodospirillaceae bacterium]
MITSACADYVTEQVSFEAQETYPGGSAAPLDTVTGLLTLPDSEGPHPAVLMLHGCAGLLSKHKHWARLFAEWGYASLRVDSFGPRDIDEICTNIHQPVPRAMDVNGAITYLQSRDEVDASELVVIGWSHGASVALQIAAEPGSLRQDLKQNISAAIAIYPYCSRTSQPFRAPLLVLIGRADSWTPAGVCEAMVEYLPANSEPVDLVIYEGATHSYDCQACDGVYYGYQLTFDEDAFNDTILRVEAFLNEHLEQD